MHRLRFKHLLAVAALGAAPAATGGCADNDSALFVRSVVALTAGDCTARSQPDATMLAFGRLDLEFGEPYVAALLVGNQLARQGNRDQLRTETSRIALQGSVVSVRNVAGEELTAYTTDGAGFVDPGNGNEPGYGIMFAELLPPGGIPALDAVTATAPTRVNVAVRVFGETLGGQEIESSELLFPISVCRGCLVSFPTTAVDANGFCLRGIPPEDLPCKAGQDEAVDCRLCQQLDVCKALPGIPLP
jgi:hypothetical protein